MKASLETGDLNWSHKTELLLYLSDEIVKYTANPNSNERKQVAIALIEKYPALKSSIGDGTHAWCTRLYDKLRKYRRQKRKINTALQPRQLEGVLKQVKRKLQLIAMPEGEDKLSIKAHEEWLLKQYQKSSGDINKKLLIIKWNYVLPIGEK